MTYFSELKNDLFKFLGGVYCVLVLFALSNLDLEDRSQEEFNSFIDNIGKDSQYFLYDTSRKAKEAKQWIDTGIIGSRFYDCLKTSKVRTGGGAVNTYKRYMVIKSHEQGYLLTLTVFDSGKVYFITYNYFKEYGLGTIKTNESTRACFLPNKHAE